MIKYRKYTLLSAAAGAAFLMTGCGVTVQQLNEVREVAEEALRTANTADYHAAAAKKVADETQTDNHRVMKKLGMKKMMK